MVDALAMFTMANLMVLNGEIDEHRSLTVEEYTRRKKAEDARLRAAQDALARYEAANAREEDFVDAGEYRDEDSTGWDDYIGQAALKNRLRISIDSAKARGRRLDHVLLASGMPGVGKTTMARIIAKEMGGKIVELQPKFSTDNLIAAAQSLDDGDVLFIDEIHKLAEVGKRGAEALLGLLEQGVIFMDGRAIQVADITVVGATTDADMLPEPVIDRFKIKPYFEAYSVDELALITTDFMLKHDYDWDVKDDEDLIYGIAEACRGIPRQCEEFVMAARDLRVTTNRRPKVSEVLAFAQVEPDGMTRQHVQYLVKMMKNFRRINRHDQVEYVAGEKPMQSMLRETTQGIHRIERYLMECGYLDRSPSGRRLTPLGIDKAAQYIARGL